MRTRTMGNFASESLPQGRAEPPAKVERTLGPPPDDCAAGECIYERACPLDGRCVVRDVQEGEALVEAELARAALDRMDAGRPQEPVAEAVSSAAVPVRRGPGRPPTWTREKAIARVREVAVDGVAPTTDVAKIPGATVTRLFGSWTALVEAAGLDPRPRRGKTAAAVSSKREPTDREEGVSAVAPPPVEMAGGAAAAVTSDSREPDGGAEAQAELASRFEDAVARMERLRDDLAETVRDVDELLAEVHGRERRAA